MKKYLLVCWDKYYPGGGLSNIKNSSDTIEGCEEFFRNNHSEWEFDYVDIYDRDTMKIVKKIKNDD